MFSRPQFEYFRRQAIRVKRYSYSTKGKVPPVHMIQAHSGTRGRAPLFLTSALDAGKLKLAPQGQGDRYHPKNNPWYPLNTRLGEFQGPSIRQRGLVPFLRTSKVRVGIIILNGLWMPYCSYFTLIIPRNNPLYNLRS